MSAKEISEVLRGERAWWVECADCLQVLPTLPEKSVDHVITDPPYSELVHTKRSTMFAGTGGVAPDGLSRATDLGFAHIEQRERMAVAAQFSRLVRRWVLEFCDLESTLEWIAANDSAHLDHVRVGVWVKPGCAPQFSGDRPGTGAEGVVVAHPSGRKRWNGGGSHAVWTHPIVVGSSPERTVHTTQKPLPLMVELVELFTDPDEVVADPFCGSGTTGVACLRLGRRFIGIEKSEKYAALARERLEAESKGLTLKDARAGQLPLLAGV